jgi:three-Cys-motif partner protein
LFSQAMINKWDFRVYLDLFAGPGVGIIRGTNRRIPTSPLMALDITPKFDKYIFCEIDEENKNALETRVDKYFPLTDREIILGDCATKIDKILSSIPTPSRSFTVLSFCFLDPYKASNLQFSTVKSLSRLLMDFLVLIPTHMDINRNKKTYLDRNNKKLDTFLGSSKWRNHLLSNTQSHISFGNFIAKEFGLQMRGLGYIYEGLEDTVLIKNQSRNLSLYRLAFFSRNKVGMDFWRESKQRAINQLSLFQGIL